jgi:hypothetical protein
MASQWRAKTEQFDSVEDVAEWIEETLNGANLTGDFAPGISIFRGVEKSFAPLLVYEEDVD